MTGRHVAVVGAGRMGQGIAAALAFGNVAVSVVDLRDRGADAAAYLEGVRASIRQALAHKVTLGLLAVEDLEDVAALVTVVGEVDALTPMAAADLVFEAVPEVAGIKRDALAWIEAMVGDTVPIASTTSSFLVDELAGALSAPARFLNAHWLNPADLMPLVEVAPGTATGPGAVDATRELLLGVGKVPVVCAPSPGYIVPRLQALVMNEAARMVAEGVASAEDIDTAVRIGFGSRFAVLGLLEFIDWGGCDTLFHASNYLSRELGERFAPAPLVETNMTSGRRGISDGAGFYEFDPSTVDDYRAQRIADFARVLDAVGRLARHEEFSTAD
ncbi:MULTISPECIES: 3-hydroxybutyryl-CoA dehydrogenase [Gordonia]|uniref:L-gulonate 3-dehydrogenase n=2 Tax=Gordonia terrae TaxID=2055 RepID=A0AAD0KFG9_9ACTN|nr:3-hydroxybutyryl-CoA dehydrogenase [Gordonia terrae]VTR07789.1 3-hydroxyacyl-CoA dehydrogenase [Clostridioides difficile]ANY24958.1 3-hydroxybutyryl-CoA dehydrogenase [Gordonia terrae]AWO85707.1 3-hydroxybutyryl-CoA dehydrogenase [Gordonia terrae]UPW08446.1 3-hydroxybutyryl-CoA dehydrogenase [Gordonia terrae]VTS61035.1 Probable 3-hydroxybutyryl-CoA dehydrogenase [Gordonia terrae]